MARYATKPQAARYFQTSERTVRNWIGRGLIRGYRLGARSIVVDLDEIEQMLASTPSTVARDGRRVYGPRAKIVDLSGVVMAETDR